MKNANLIIIPLYTFYSILIFIYAILEFLYFTEETEIMIVDNMNFSYIEYISDLKLIPEELEKKINFFDNKTHIKLSLGNFNKKIYCECFNNKSEKIIINEINICSFFNCELKLNKSNNKNYNIYKWKNNSFYAELSKYYFFQGINLKTKKCNEKLGFISCGYYDNIENEICIKKDLMKCPYKFKKINNIIFNELNSFFVIKNNTNIIINKNISLFDIIPDMKNHTNNNKINPIFKYSLKNFLIENDIYKKYKDNNDEVFLFNNNNNILRYNEKIDYKNAFIIKYKALLSKGYYKDTNYILYYFIDICLLILLLIKFLFELSFIFILLPIIEEYIKLSIEKNYNEIFKKYKKIKGDIVSKIIYLIKIFESTIFFYFIYDVRKLNKIYKGHIWNSKFRKILRNEYIFMSINLILYISYFIPIVLYIIIGKKFKNKNSLDMNNFN